VSTVEKRHRQKAAEVLEFVNRVQAWIDDGGKCPYWGGDRIAQAIADAEASAKPRWIPPTEPPKQESRQQHAVLLYDGQSVLLSWYERGDWWVMVDGHEEPADIIGWVPFPEERP
jgi:hypothetical protein